MGMNSIRKLNSEVDKALKNQLNRTIDEHNLLEDYTLNLLECEFNPCKWINDEDYGLINHSLGSQEYIRFNVGLVDELEYKDIKNVELRIEYSISNVYSTVPVLTAIGVGRNNSMVYIHPEQYFYGTSFTIDCKLFGFSRENLNSIIHDDNFEFELMLNGNLSNCSITISKLELYFKFDSGFEEERLVIENRIEDLLQPSFTTVEVGETSYSIEYDENKIILTEIEDE